MRRVSILSTVKNSAGKYFQERDGKRPIVIYQGEYDFHGWSRDPDGEVVAIIEDDDGVVSTAYAYHVKFIDKAKTR